jgi:hypothetical protein
MKSLSLAASILAFAAAVDLSPALATEPANSLGNAGQGLPQAAGSESRSGAAARPHYQRQYLYAGRHARFGRPLGLG